MVRAVSKYSLLSMLPPQSEFDWHNAVELQPITERRTEPLHRRLSVPYIRLREGYLGLRSTTCAPREWWNVAPIKSASAGFKEVTKGLAPVQNPAGCRRLFVSRHSFDLLAPEETSQSAA